MQSRFDATMRDNLAISTTISFRSEFLNVKTQLQP